MAEGYAGLSKPAGGEIARQIASTAMRLFALHGYDATPVRRIVEEAGVTKPTLYYHFGSKEGLAQALLTLPMSGLVARLRSILADVADPAESLAAQVAAHFDFFREDLDRGRFFFAIFFGPNEPTLAGELSGFGRQLTEELNAGVDRLVRAGTIDASKAGRFAAACRGAIIIQAMDRLFEKPGCGSDSASFSEPADSLARTLVDDLIRGFGTTRNAREN